ncbi:DNA-directed RNA polymerase specialized sigma subunit, sigma24 family [endosymbiont of Ridgeia piscesae]|nr:DNA-directed RNA polymerase specialized sigma subunit, sigma24 family [endosymbiont of Ridgeia piscesae]KRT60024.1 DNA-directed RNA polymerase specialized sigma subunit, sigma24 family [endosymbiont of Ridgeia piscesae]
MTKRRFDTEVLLEQMLAGSEEAIQSFYERYRGRIYRFIARQCGADNYGSQVYRAVWSRFIAARRRCSTIRQYKVELYRELHEALWEFGGGCDGMLYTSPELILKVDDDTKWGVLLLEEVRCLPKHLRECFLFRYEIGLTPTAIGAVLGKPTAQVSDQLAQAEEDLLTSLEVSGFSKHLELKAVYQLTRQIKPPALWDMAVLGSVPEWLEWGGEYTMAQPTISPPGVSGMKQIASSLSTTRKSMHRHELFYNVIEYRN